MDEGLRLEDWIGEKVTVNVYSTAEVTSSERVLYGAEVVSDEESVSEKQLVLGIRGFLAGVDQNGVIVLFDPRDVASQHGRVPSPDPEHRSRYVLIPWQRVSLIERIVEAQEGQPE